jgi:putative transposase
MITAGAPATSTRDDTSFPVDLKEYFLALCRYVDANALRADLVQRAEQRRWSGLCRRARGPGKHNKNPKNE